MERNKIIALLQKIDVLMEGHFIYTSGKHGDKYLQCARIFQTPSAAVALCEVLADKFRDSGIEVVIGPAVGAVQMAYEISRQLGVDNYFTERADGEMTLRRGFVIKPGMKCLLVEDVVTTGGTVIEVKKLVEGLGGVVAGVGSIVDRACGKVDFGVPFKSVIQIEAEAYDPEDCPLCKEGNLPPVKPGSRGIK